MNQKIPSMLIAALSLLLFSATSCTRLGTAPSEEDFLELSSGGESSSSADEQIVSSSDPISSSTTTASSSSKTADGPFNAYIAPWPGQAIAAYSIIADDFCGNLPGQMHADTMMANRGMAMTFAAIVQSCWGEHQWQDARDKIGRGHEMANHSMTHPCFTSVDECGSGPVVGPADFDYQLRQSSDKIEAEAGVYPTFMIFPYDCASDESLRYLKDDLGYVGARMGQKQALNLDTFDPFRPNFDVNWPAGQKENQRWNLNELVDAILEQGSGWAIREIHGVDDGWGPVPYAEMQAHANHLKSKVDAGLLWVSTPSRVIQYHNLREQLQIATAINGNSRTISLRGALPPKGHYSVPLTVVVQDLPHGSWEVSQAGEPPQTVQVNGDIRVEMDPWAGDLLFLHLK